MSGSSTIVPMARARLMDLLHETLSVSKKEAKRVLEAQQVRVNGKVEKYGSRVVAQGDSVTVGPEWQAATRAASVRPRGFSLLYEDAEVLVVDKPAAWECSAAECARMFGPGLHLVHRLDRSTTGALMLAKSAVLTGRYMQHFAERRVQKQYLAVVDGVPAADHGVCKSLLRRRDSTDHSTPSGQTAWRSVCSGNGLAAETRWRRLAVGERAALLLCEPVTGRTHQIRVHLAEMAHPILVDSLYAKRFSAQLFATRPLLHSYHLSVGHVSATAPLPADMRSAMQQLDIAFDESILTREPHPYFVQIARAI
ncbi:MAG: RluA family pseudouridine synthase [archaeon]|nr:RluA family pseudouridine synthase [archaeon]